MRDVSKSVANIRHGLAEINKRVSQGKQDALNSFKESGMYDIISPTPILDFDNLPVRSGGDADYPPQLSIVIPIYNVEEWLGPCLRSIQAQTLTAWECLLINDGSTDFSDIICENFAKSDKRFRVIHQSNQGVSAARNAGIRKAAAPFLAFVDPDDILSENFFESQLVAINEIGADLSVSVMGLVEENGGVGKYMLENHRIYCTQTTYPRHFLNHEMVIDAFVKNLFSCTSWGKIFSRQLWGDALFPVRVDLGEDMMTVPLVCIKANKAVSVTDAVYYYRQRQKSLLNGTVTRERLQLDLWASGKMVEQLTAYLPERKDDFEALKLLYDLGCIRNYRKSANQNKKFLMHIYMIELEEAARRQKSGFYKYLEEQIEREKGKSNALDPKERG